MDPAIVDYLNNSPNIGKNMFPEFVTDVIEKASKPLSDVIKTQPVHILKQTTSGSREGHKLGSGKANAALVTKLFLSLQARPEADIDAFLKHENQRVFGEYT